MINCIKCGSFQSISDLTSTIATHPQTQTCAGSWAGVSVASCTQLTGSRWAESTLSTKYGGSALLSLTAASGYRDADRGGTSPHSYKPHSLWLKWLSRGFKGLLPPFPLTSIYFLLFPVLEQDIKTLGHSKAAAHKGKTRNCPVHAKRKVSDSSKHLRRPKFTPQADPQHRNSL